LPSDICHPQSAAVPPILLAHFARIADAPAAIPRLRQFILDLAIRGKLVEQDSNDEPASHFLQRVQAQKERLIREGGMAKQKSLRGLDPDEPPYAVPRNWQWVRLGALVRSMTNGIYKPSSFYDEDGVICLRMYNIRAGRINFENAKRIRLTQEELQTYGLDAGDLLVNRVNSRELVGKAAPVPRCDTPLIFESKNIRVRFLETAALPYYSNLIFQTAFYRGILEGYAKQTCGQATVSQPQLAELPLPLPPLAEQHRIVAKVDELMGLCDRLEATQTERETRRTRFVAATHADLAQPTLNSQLSTFFINRLSRLTARPADIQQLRQTILNLAVRGKLVPQDPHDEPAQQFLARIQAEKVRLEQEGKLRGGTSVRVIDSDGDLAAIPSTWAWVPFGDIMFSRDGDRIPVSKEERNTRAKTYDYYGASGVIDKIDSYLFDKPLLLIGEDGANLINRSTPIAFIARGKYWVNNHAHVLDGITENFLRFIELHINAIDLKPYVTGTAQPKMNQAKMNSIPIALPPEAEQHRIVAKVDELMALCDRLETQLTTTQAQSRRLLESTLHQALTPSSSA